MALPEAAGDHRKDIERALKNLVQCWMIFCQIVVEPRCFEGHVAAETILAPAFGVKFRLVQPANAGYIDRAGKASGEEGQVSRAGGGGKTGRSGAKGAGCGNLLADVRQIAGVKQFSHHVGSGAVNKIDNRERIFQRSVSKSMLCIF